MSNSLYYNPKQEVETCFLPLNLNPQLSYHHFKNHENGNHFSTKTPFQHYTLESSSTLTGSCNINDWGSTVSFSSNESPASHPDNTTRGSCATDDIYDLKHKLQELETAMLGPESDLVESYDGVFRSNLTCMSSTQMGAWGQVVDMIVRKDLKQILIACAKAVSDNDPLIFHWLMDELRQMVSVSGEPIQRLGAYMLEGLVAKQALSGSSIYRALRCKEPQSADLLSYKHILFEVCPYIKFGYMSANGAIAMAMKDEGRVHIIDFQIGQGSQWLTLIQAFAARPGGPPRICITAIDDSYSARTRGGGLNIVGQRLSRLAKSYKVPFEFHAAAITGCEQEIKKLRVQPGEALAVSFAFTLHHMPDESVSTENRRDSLLRLVRSLSPKVVTLVEQECNTNSAPFFPRFVETLDYYAAMFESMDVTLPRDHKDRINVEQHCLARDVVNLIACEGAERVERQELLGKWRSRFIMAGFTPSHLSPLVNTAINMLLKGHSDKYRLEERDGALYLGWMNRNLVAACAWRCS